MPNYVALLNWTEQGIRGFKDTTKRADAFGAALAKLGARLLNIYWTDGPYDLVAVIEAPDDETANAGLLRVAALGNVRTMTLRAFSREEMDRVIARSA